jgi:hypothetical protein
MRAEEARKLTEEYRYKVDMTKVYERIKQAARRGSDCTSYSSYELKYIVDELVKQGYKVDSVTPTDINIYW